MSGDLRPELAALRERLDRTLDAHREEAREKRHQNGYRTARENLEDLVDEDSFLEYGQLAVAAQRNRREYEDLQSNTPADGDGPSLSQIGALRCRWKGAVHRIRSGHDRVLVGDLYI